MKKAPFNAEKILVDAKTGLLTTAEIRKAIKRAEDLGKEEVAQELRLFIVSPSAFAGDPAPEEIRKRIAKMISALVSMGLRPNRTRQMIRTHGIMKAIDRIAKKPEASRNFEKLRDASLLHLTAEAIVLDYPKEKSFSEEAFSIAKSRIGSC